MKSASLTFLFLALTVFTVPLNAADGFESYAGTWEYRQTNSGTASGYDPDGERLAFTINKGQLKGIYFGLEREGEHGLFYTAVEVKDIHITDKQIRFVVPERFLYVKRPKNQKEARRTSSAGFTRNELKMNGKLADGKLILNCFSEHYECPAPVLEFRKGRWR